MFRHPETITLFSATVAQAVFIAFFLQESAGWSSLFAVPVSVIIGFAFSAIELSVCNAVYKSWSVEDNQERGADGAPKR